MAAPVVRCFLGRVLTQSHTFTKIGQHSTVLPSFASLSTSCPYYAAKNANKHKPSKKIKPLWPQERKRHFIPPLPKEPTDDVYLTWCYQRPVYGLEVALDMLKKFQKLDFTSPKQLVHVDLTLDMAKEKKKKVDPFLGTILLPYRFTDGINKVLVFTENKEEALLATENGAAIAGGTELIKPILTGEIQADFYVAVPPMSTKLSPLRGTLKKRYPRSKNGSMGYDILQMLEFFKMCHTFEVEDENLIHTPIAMLDMPNDQIVANLDAVIKDVCKRKPLSYGPFVTHLSIRSSTSESLDLKTESFLPEEAEKQKEKKEEEEEEEKGELEDKEKDHEDSDDEEATQKSM